MDKTLPDFIDVNELVAAMVNVACDVNDTWMVHEIDKENLRIVMDDLMGPTWHFIDVVAAISNGENQFENKEQEFARAVSLDEYAVSYLERNGLASANYDLNLFEAIITPGNYAQFRTLFAASLESLQASPDADADFEQAFIDTINNGTFPNEEGDFYVMNQCHEPVFVPFEAGPLHPVGRP